jgi:hypothetical protein
MEGAGFDSQVAGTVWFLVGQPCQLFGGHRHIGFLIQYTQTSVATNQSITKLNQLGRHFNQILIYIVNNSCMLGLAVATQVKYRLKQEDIGDVF